MPELPEVQTVVNTLLPRLRGAVIAAVCVRRSDVISPAGFDFEKALAARRIAQIARRGKRIIFQLDSGERFFIHLGMTGRLTLQAADAPLAPHTHVTIDAGGVQVRFTDPRRFGGIWWLGADADGEHAMGPEPLTIRPAALARRLARTKRVIKSALLDQQLIAGLGNIYVDEALFTAGLHPQLRADRLSAAQVRRLNRAIKQVLRRALRHRGSTLRDYRDADGKAGEFTRLHRVYDRAGKPCTHCKTPIVRIVIGQRSTHFCPNCQPAREV